MAQGGGGDRQRLETLLRSSLRGKWGQPPAGRLPESDGGAGEAEGEMPQPTTTPRASQTLPVQDTEAATLDGLVDGIQWLLEQTKCKNAH